MSRLTTVATVVFSIALVDAQQAVVHKKDIVKAVVEQFDRSDAVALGELHGSQADQDLRIQIIRSPDFARKVHIVVVEGLNSLYQEDLDRYIRGEIVPKDQVQRLWRDSTEIFVGPIVLTIEEQFLNEVRAMNSSLPDDRKCRVIAADPAIDWGKIPSPSEFRSILGKRAEFGAEVIEREALRKRQKALLILRLGWFTRNQQRKTPNGFVPVSDTIGAMLEKDFPGRVYVITPLRGAEYPDTRKLERLFGTEDLPVLARLKGTVFGEMDANEFIPAHPSLLLGAPPPPFHQYRDGATMADAADAIIYRGRAPDPLVQPGPSYAKDAAYAAELNRRAGFAP